MRAIVVDPPGKTADSLRLAEVPDPQPSDEEVLLRVHATALNRADMMQRMGSYPAQHGASEILGLELAGEVIGVGSQVRGLSVGDRVYGLSGGGGYAEMADAASVAGDANPRRTHLPRGGFDSRSVFHRQHRCAHAR